MLYLLQQMYIDLNLIEKFNIEVTHSNKFFSFCLNSPPVTSNIVWR